MSCLLVVYKVKAHLEICYWISAAKSKLLPKATQLLGIAGLNLSSYSCIDHIFYDFVMLLKFLPSSFNLLANVSEFLSCMRLSLTLASSSAGVSISKLTLQTPPQTLIAETHLNAFGSQGHKGLARTDKWQGVTVTTDWHTSYLVPSVFRWSCEQWRVAQAPSQFCKSSSAGGYATLWKASTRIELNLATNKAFCRLLYVEVDSFV